MRNWWLGFSAGLLTAGLGLAQPCTLASVEPLRWPEGVPTENVLVGDIGYAMGVYTLGALEIPPSGKAGKGFPVVSRDGRNWVLADLSLQHPRRSDRDDVTGLLPPVYAKGVWLAIFAYGDWVLRSQDGLHWQEVGYGFDPIIDSHPTGGLFWDGKRFLKVGFWGGVWASADGGQFQELTPAPNLYPIRWVAVNHVGCVVTDYKEAGYVTHDFQTWRWLPFTGGPAVTAVNGWLEAIGNIGPDRYNGVDRCLRTRDGARLRYVSEKKPHGPGPLDRRLASARYFIIGHDDLDAGTPYLEIFPGRIVRFEPHPDLGTLYAYQFGGKLPPFDGRYMLFVGSVFSKASPKPTASHFRLVRFSCADFGAPLVLPGMAHQDGALGARWRSDLVLHYPGPGGSEVRVEWLPYGQANENPRFVRLWLNAGETKVIADAVAALFQAEGNGAVRVVWLGEERGFARGRTYNETASGTFGQAVEAFGWEDGVDRCYVPENESEDPNNVPSSWQDEEEMWLVGLADSGSDTNGFRTNVGLQNLWRNEADVEVVWMGADGQELGRRQFHLRAFEGVQWFRPLRELGLGPLEGVTAVVRLLSGETRVAAYASVVDNRTGDSVYVPGRKDLVQGLTPFPWERKGTAAAKPSGGTGHMGTHWQKPERTTNATGKAAQASAAGRSTP